MSDPYRLSAASSCGSRLSKGRASRTEYQGLSCDHWRFCEKAKRRSAVKTASLGSPVGLVCSNATIANPLRKAEATAKNFATYLKAFALIYVLPEVEWTEEKIDMLLEQGMELYRCSSETNQSKDDDCKENQLLGNEIYTNEEKRIRRNFILEGHTFTMALEPRYLGGATRPHIIKNLKSVLQEFFKSSRYCLLLTRVGHLLIWRRRKAFFVLDVKGRRMHDLRCDKDNGVAMLVCLKTLDNVVYLASNLSGITPRDVFTVRELVMLNLKTPDGRIYLRDSSYRSAEFKVVNKSYAYLKATLHLSLSRNKTVKNRSSLMVAVGSILASKIDHPANWDTNMLDRLICYGVELCSNRWSDCMRKGRPIDLDKFPTQLRLGQFVVDLKLKPGVRLGYWECGSEVISKDFEANFREALEGFGNVVFQISNQMYALWVKNGFYYLLDPYRHSIMGTHVEEDQCKGAKWATLRMFRDRMTMLSVFHQLLQESNGQSNYFLHAVRIRNIAECPHGCVPSPLSQEVDTGDVESLNEPILYSDQIGTTVQEHCLAEISDCECEKEDTVDTDLKELQISEEQSSAESAEDEVHEEHTRSSSSISQKSIIPIPKASKSNRTLQKTKKSKKNQRTENQSLGKKPKVPYKEMKRTIVSDEDTKQSSSNPLVKKPADLAKKQTTKYETDFKRQAGGARVSVNSTSTSKAVSRSSKNPKEKWSAKELAIIRLGPKASATNFILQRDACIQASSASILHSESHSTPKDASVTKSGNISTQTDIRDNLRKPKGNSGTSVPSGIDRRSERAPLQKQNGSESTELSESGRCSPSERSESPTRYPGYTREPQLLAVAGSESGTVESLNRLLGSAFKVANRVLTMTPWGNYVVFRHSPNSGQGSASTWFFLFEGCTCNIDRFRHLDLSVGTAGLLAFRKLSEVVCHMIDSRREKALNTLKNRSRGNVCTKH